MKTIGIVGTRRRDGQEAVLAISRAFLKIFEPGDTVVSGGCREGGDRIAEALADFVRTGKLIHYPDQSKLNPKLPPRVAWTKINYARNTLIAQDSSYLIAAIAPDRKGGTEDTIRKWLHYHADHPERLILV